MNDSSVRGMPTMNKRSRSSLTPLMQQYREIKSKYQDCLLFFRLGDFYELFYDDAVIASRELDLVLTTRDKGKQNPVPMCGVPWFTAEQYIEKLVEKGYRVALCEQVEDPALAKGLVRREVVRVYTPGTFVSGTGDTVLPVVASLCLHHKRYGLAWCNLLTGDIVATEFEIESFNRTLLDTWHMIQAKEFLLPEQWGRDHQQRLQELGIHPPAWGSVPAWAIDEEYAHEMICRTFRVMTCDAFDLTTHVSARMAVGMLLHYLEERDAHLLETLNHPRFLHVQDRLILDMVTIRNLELFQNARDGGARGTLFSVINKTLTPMGKRLLQDWLLKPLVHIETIEERLDAVEAFYRAPNVLDTIRDHLKTIPDIERVCTRIQIHTATPPDLLRLRNALKPLPSLWTALRQLESKGLLRSLQNVHYLGEDVAETLDKALVDEPPVSIRDGGVFREGYDRELDELRSIAQSSKTLLARIEKRERERTGIPNLRVKYNKVFGYFIEVTKSYLHRVPDSYERRQTLTNAERFITPELKNLEEKILTAEERALKREQELYQELMYELSRKVSVLRELSRFVALIDVLQSLALTALKNRYVRPRVIDSDVLEIHGGRHPVIEVLQKEKPFIPNDIQLNQREKQILVITGPNMGGKSTYLRQTALICILAQMGSFVPADAATIGVVDRVFTRVGASDFLAQGQSTFMVEMLETAYILHHATPKSLIVLDEIGRGTSTFDGLAIAWAVLEYIHEKWNPGPRTLFATHFHELVHLAKMYSRIHNLSVLVKETEDGVLFLYQVVSGPCDQSYGVHVAQLAGLPEQVVQRAHTLLKQLGHLEDQLQETLGNIRGTRPPALFAQKKQAHKTFPYLVQKTLLDFDPSYQLSRKMLRELSELDLESMRPIDAWHYLEDLQKKVRSVLAHEKVPNRKKRS